MKAAAIAVLFDTHPTVNSFFVTSDDQAFFTQEMADSHGQKLKDRTVNTVTREELEETESFEAGNMDQDWAQTQQQLTSWQKGQITKAVNAQKKLDEQKLIADQKALQEAADAEELAKGGAAENFKVKPAATNAPAVDPAAGANEVVSTQQIANTPAATAPAATIPPATEGGAN